MFPKFIGEHSNTLNIVKFELDHFPKTSGKKQISKSEWNHRQENSILFGLVGCLGRRVRDSKSIYLQIDLYNPPEN